LWLFDKLIWTVLSYGVEVWGGERRNAKIRGEVYEVTARSGEVDSMVFSKRRIAKGGKS